MVPIWVEFSYQGVHSVAFHGKIGCKTARQSTRPPTGRHHIVERIKKMTNILTWTRKVRPFLRSGLCALILGTSAMAVIPACGGPAMVMPTEWPTAPTVAIKLNYKANNADAESFLGPVEASLTSAFSSAGYTIVQDEADAQVIGNITINSVKDEGLGAIIQTNIDTTSWDVRVDASFVGKVDKALVDRSTTEFNKDKGEVDDGAVAYLVVQLNNTKKLHKYQEKLAAQEDKMWKDASVKDCQDALAKNSCDSVDAYLAMYPKGKYATEARKAIEDNALAQELNKEDEVWAAADVDSCKAPTKPDDCDGVVRYLKTYPNGTHLADARAAMKAGEAKLDRLKAAEDATARKERKVRCIKMCRRRYQEYRPSSYNILVGRCISNECS